MNARYRPPVFPTPVFPALVVLGITVVVTLVSAVPGAHPATAQQVHNTYGSPLDTLMNTHLTTDVPEAHDFVKATSPDPKSLTFTPLTGPETRKDPDRPKPRDPKGVAALQAELESAGAMNASRAKDVRPVRVPRLAARARAPTKATVKAKPVATSPAR